MDMNKMSAIGSAASAPKSKAMSGPKETFDESGGVRIRKVSGDGTYLVTADMKIDRPKTPRDPYPSTYCPPKEFTAKTLGEAFAKAEDIFANGVSGGEKASAPAETSAPAAPSRPAPPAPTSSYSGY